MTKIKLELIKLLSICTLRKQRIILSGTMRSFRMILTQIEYTWKMKVEYA